MVQIWRENPEDLFMEWGEGIQISFWIQQKKLLEFQKWILHLKKIINGFIESI